MIINSFKSVIKQDYKSLFLNGSRRYRHEVSKAPIYSTIKLDDGSTFISRKSETKTSILPPALKNKHKEANYNKLTDMQIKEMQELRLSQPEVWTRSKLAKKFNCSEHFVYLKAHAPDSYHQVLKDKKAEEWNKLGFKRQLIFINRQRRRAEW